MLRTRIQQWSNMTRFYGPGDRVRIRESLIAASPLWKHLRGKIGTVKAVAEAGYGTTYKVEFDGGTTGFWFAESLEPANVWLSSAVTGRFSSREPVLSQADKNFPTESEAAADYPPIKTVSIEEHEKLKKKYDKAIEIAATLLNERDVLRGEKRRLLELAALLLEDYDYTLEEVV